MFNVVFNLNGQDTIIYCKRNEEMKNVFNKFASKTNIDVNKVYLLYNGKMVNENLTCDALMNENDKKRNSMNILAIETNLDIENENIIQTNDIICPKCQEAIFIKLHDYKVHFEDCENGHTIQKTLLFDFMKMQKIDISKIVCDICKKKNKGNTFQNEFYYCLFCRAKICPLCKANHDNTHKIVKFEEKNIFCHKHKETFTKFCQDCDKNLCMRCEKEHKNHTSIYYTELLPNEDIINEMKEFKKSIDKFNADMKIIIKELENISNKINEYYNIYYNISINYIKNNLEKRNYKILKNMNEFINYKNFIMNDMKKIVLEDKIENKINNLINIYYSMSKQNNNKITEEREKDFLPVLNQTNYILADIEINLDNLNKNKRIINSSGYYNRDIENNCIIKINDEIIDFSYYYKFSKIGKNKIQYIFKNQLKDISGMFKDCDIMNIDFSFFDSENVTNVENIFENCFLNSINLSNFNAKNISNIDGLFKSCKSVKYLNLSNFCLEKTTSLACTFSKHKSLVDINLSNFNAKNVNDLSHMFSDCVNLKTINLSNFRGKKITNMDYMFYGCKSLINIDFSHINIKKLIDMSYMFDGCESLKTLDLSFLNTSKVSDMSNLFNKCFLLENINLSNFNTKNVVKMNKMFGSCQSLKNIDLSNFNTENAIILKEMFYCCKSLTNLDLSSFNTEKVEDISYLFYNCESLISLNLSNFNTENVTNMGCLFSNCKSLTYLNIENFNTNKCYSDNINEIFKDCSSLRKYNVITKDAKIQNVKDLNLSYCILI